MNIMKIRCQININPRYDALHGFCKEKDRSQDPFDASSLKALGLDIGEPGEDTPAKVIAAVFGEIKVLYQMQKAVIAEFGELKKARDGVLKAFKEFKSSVYKRRAAKQILMDHLAEKRQLVKVGQRSRS